MYYLLERDSELGLAQLLNNLCICPFLRNMVPPLQIQDLFSLKEPCTSVWRTVLISINLGDRRRLATKGWHSQFNYGNTIINVVSS
jgi:hypothetical protein